MFRSVRSSPSMGARHTTFWFTLRPTAAQEQALWRNAGAARFAFNQSLRIVEDALDARELDPRLRAPWSGFDLINAFNRWKRSAEAGVHEDGKVGLAWRREVNQQVFEEAAVDLGRALEAFSSSRKTGRKRVGFPTFKTRVGARQSFRIRNKKVADHDWIRVDGVAGHERTIHLPRVGVLQVRECTRKLRRMLRKHRARLLFATVSHRVGGHWKVSLNLEAEPLHPSAHHPASALGSAIGVDRGLRTFAVLADAAGHEIERIEAPRPLHQTLPRLRYFHRAVTRKKEGSRNRHRARLRLSKLHHRIGNVRRDFIQRTSSRLAKTHGHLVLETLSTSGLMRTRLARSLADSAWAMFASSLAYIMAWRGGRLMFADRFYPSTRRCSGCGGIGAAIPMWKRTFQCRLCGHEADRDTNAAACLGQYPSLSWPHVAAKRAETKNVCREGSAGAWGNLMHETRLDEAERACAQRPRRTVSIEAASAC